MPKKQILKDKIKEVYHNKNGIPGHRMMKKLLEKIQINLSKWAVLKYMKELSLKSIVMRKKPVYKKSNPNKIFTDKIKRDFSSSKPNEKWLIDFTYINLSNGEKRYNCSILDLFDRYIVSSETSKEITSRLAIIAIKNAINKNKISSKIILHSDQGSQFTSKEFNDFCLKNDIIQSMSKAGCPYDNSSMERFFNTFKNELIYNFSFKNYSVLINSINNYISNWYNFERPHSANFGRSPFQKRFSC